MFINDFFKFTPNEKKIILIFSFAIILLTSNVITVKQVSIGPILATASFFLYPFSYMIGDILTEVYGYKMMRKVILLGLCANFIFVICTTIAIYLPSPNFYHGQDAFLSIFSLTPRIFIASVIAYLVGEILNAWSMEKIKILTKGKYLYIRTIGSTFIGEALDTLIFCSIAFYGVVPHEFLVSLMLGYFFVKMISEIFIATPGTYLLVRWLKK